MLHCALHHAAVATAAQPITSVTLHSLRQQIGVVPQVRRWGAARAALSRASDRQDTLLFNDTVMYNIHYGNLAASEADVLAAARRQRTNERLPSARRLLKARAAALTSTPRFAKCRSSTQRWSANAV